MRLRSPLKKRTGSVLVEYGLLIAGVGLTCVLSIAVLGHKTFHVYGIMADIMPGASVDDNQPIRHVQTIPIDTTLGQPIQLDAKNLVKEGGTDRMKDIFDTPNAGDSLIVDLDHN
ncbi:MAG: hypothetical protein JO112_12795 [Planctomycetes bacterium]|nr:hypothetical protein [Planctomycetota bacterium]